MLVLSWNVASLPKVMSCIERHFGFKTFDQYISDHLKADILCLQETKVNESSLSDRGIASRLGLLSSKYDAFSCPCRMNDKKGFNGVITYVRKGLTQQANRSPLNDPDLDKEGRCVLTVHSSFLLLNVYVPNASSNVRSEYKIKFLETLRVRMKELRAEYSNKPIILAGDLNLHRRARDLFPSFRMLRSKNFPVRYASEKRVRAMLETRKIMAKEVRTSKGLETKYVVTVQTDTTRAQLGKPYVCKDSADADYDLDIGFPGLSISQYLECADKLGCPVSPSERKRLQDHVAETRMCPKERRWFETISSSMIDTFTHFHESARGRYTCWNQYKNQRYINAGARIDYILIDRDFFLAHASEKSDPLYCPPELMPTKYLDSARVAASAAVDGGIWKQASFDGGGLQEVKKDLYRRHVSPTRGAGIVYTPPQYSDHVAVAVVLENVDMDKKNSIVLSEDSRTRRCQPWSRQRDLRSFFGGDSGNSSSSSSSSRSGVGGSNNLGGIGVKSNVGVLCGGKKKKRRSFAAAVSSKKKKKKGGIASFFCKKS